MIMQKYQPVLDLGSKLNIQNGDVSEENGVLKIKGTAKTAYEKTFLGMKSRPLAVKTPVISKLISDCWLHNVPPPHC